MTTTPFPAPTVTANAPEPSTARGEIAVFLGTTAALLLGSTALALSEGVDVRHIGEASPLGAAAMYTQAFFPLVGAVVARSTVGRRRGTEWGVRRTAWRNIGLGWLYALLVGLVGAGIAWATGVVGVSTDGAGIVPLGLTVLVLPYVVLALGEDLGWRGLLVSRLAEIAGPRTVVLVSGLAWSAFHVPLIVWLGGTPDGVPVWFAVLAFSAGTVALGSTLASMQLRWGIWPGVLTHAVLNATMYHVVEPLSVERVHSGWFASETGALAAVVGVAAAALWWRRFPLVRTEDGGTAAPTVG